MIVVNKLVENLLGKNSEDLVGKSLMEILPGIDSLLIENILSGKSESYSTSVSVRKKTWMAMIAPIQYDKQFCLFRSWQTIQKRPRISRGICCCMDLRRRPNLKIFRQRMHRCEKCLKLRKCMPCLNTQL